MFCQEFPVTPTLSTPDGKIKPNRRGNCRATIRYRCAPATIGKVISTDNHDFQTAWIIDLSLTGLGIQLMRPLTVGQPVTITVRSYDNSRRFVLTGRVVHCNPCPQGEYIAGCELNKPLTHEDLDQIL